MVSLKDIASDVGVSIPLVSKVLNNRLGSTGASKQTIERIKQSARRLGYRKNQAAAALRTGRQNVVGVFLHWMGEYGSGLIESLIKGISAGCVNHGIRQQICFFETRDQFEAIARSATPGEMDGLILAGLQHPETLDILLDIAAGGLPVVSAFGQTALHNDIPNAGSNEDEICRKAITHLQHRGCKKIAAIGPVSVRHAELLACRGQMALRPEDLPFYQTPDFNYDSGMAVMEPLFGDERSIDGIFAFSDQLALAAIHWLVGKGMDVPGQVKVVGVDNSPFCDFSLVPITSVSGEDFIRGEKAVEMIRRLRDGQKVESFDVAPKLIVRASTGG